MFPLREIIETLQMGYKVPLYAAFRFKDYDRCWPNVGSGEWLVLPELRRFYLKLEEALTHCERFDPGVTEWGIREHPTMGLISEQLPNAMRYVPHYLITDETFSLPVMDVGIILANGA